MNKQRENGQAAEDYVRNFFKARESSYSEYDLETKNYLIEVKSCDAFTRSGKRKGWQIGRFAINKQNHLALKRVSEDHNKKAIYIFVVRVGKCNLLKRCSWEDVHLPPMKTHCHISWKKLWGG